MGGEARGGTQLAGSAGDAAAHGGRQSAGAAGSGGAAAAGASGSGAVAGASPTAGAAGTPVGGNAGAAGSGSPLGGNAGAAGVAGAAGAAGGATCGDGTQDPGEACDLGAANDDHASGSCPGTCRTNCECPACGDGVTDFVLGEQCDDLNLVDGDGCSASCRIEPIPSCGDGNLDIDQGEECDDGNTATGDGCDDVCQLEPVGQDCGDGSVDGIEKCDDNNLANGDGCNPTCNLTNTVTTLATGIVGDALAVDQDYLWIGGCTDVNVDPCHIQRVDIDDCLQNGNCTPTTVVGGSCGTLQDGNGTSAVVGCVGTLTTDGNTLWFGDQHTIRAVDLSTLDVTTIAGDPNLCAAIDGVGSSALFFDIRGLTYYDGFVYLLDGCEEVLRRFDPATGEVVTIAGQRIPSNLIPQTGPNQYQCQSGWDCTDGVPMDGQGSSAVFGSPRYMAADNAGNLYITDTNGELVRTYNTVTGWVGTLAGSTRGYVDGVGTAAQLDRPRGITSDGTSLYWAEQVESTVRQVVIKTAEVSTLVGVRGCAGTADGTGADASQDWSGNCSAAALSGLPQITTPFGGIAFHYPSQAIFLLESGRLRLIE
jgi:cysteine-rich repeat protein